MIKSTFSRNPAKLPPSSSAKKPSLASLAQKLQDVDLSSTSQTECTGTLTRDGQSNLLVPVSSAENVNSILVDTGKYTWTSVLVHNDEVDCSSVNRLIPDAVKNVVDLGVRSVSQPLSSSGIVRSACLSQLDECKIPSQWCSVQNKMDSSASDFACQLNDCSEFDRLCINPTARDRCQSARPSSFGQTLSAVPRPFSRSVRRLQKTPFYARFSYIRQRAAAAGTRQQRWSQQTIRPFDFSTPSPDDIVVGKQKLAFGTSTK